MYYLSDICLLCLNSKQLESVLVLDDNGITVQEQLKYCLPEITIPKTRIPEFICSSCRITVQSFFKLKKKCLANYNRLIHYRQLLQGSSDLRGNKFTELQVRMKKLDLLMDRDQDVDSVLNINEEMLMDRDQDVDSVFNVNEQTTIVNDDIDIKAEFIAESENNKFFLKEIKYKSASDNKQDSVSRSSCEKDNQYFLDEANFSVDPKNLSATCNNADTNGEVFKRKCYICNTVFVQKKKLIRHMIIHAGIRNHKCSVCDKKFVDKSNLTRHVKIHAGIRDHKCTVCDKMFARKYNLTQHMKIHAGIGDHKCTVCDKKFVDKFNLTRHVKIHAGIRDHKCTVCDKKFVDKFNLTRHVKIHAGIRDHKCSVCEKMFLQKCYLTKHMKIHSGIRDHKYTVCNKKFVDKSNFTKHVKIHAEI